MHDGREPNLDAELLLPYSKLRELLPDVSESDWLKLKDIALDNAMKKLIEFFDQVKRHAQVSPEDHLRVGAVVTILEKLIDIFKVQRAIIEELKEAVSKP